MVDINIKKNMPILHHKPFISSAVVWESQGIADGALGALRPRKKRQGLLRHAQVAAIERRMGEKKRGNHSVVEGGFLTEVLKRSHGSAEIST